MRAPGTVRHDDRGESLLELIVSVAITGIAVVAIVGGVAASVLMSDVHRKESTAGTLVRNYAEDVENWVDGGHFDAGATPDYSPARVGFDVPAGFAASATSVRCWNPTGNSFGTCPSGSSSVQQVTLEVSSTDQRAAESIVVIVRKP